jgi:hypothetical protein
MHSRFGCRRSAARTHLLLLVLLLLTVLLSHLAGPSALFINPAGEPAAAPTSQDGKRKLVSHSISCLALSPKAPCCAGNHDLQLSQLL